MPIYRTYFRDSTLVDATKQHDELLRNTEILRDRVGKDIATLRTLSEAVEYEFGADQEHHIRSSATILQISAIAASLIWNELVVVHDKRYAGFTIEPELMEMRRKVAEQINIMGEAVVRNEDSRAEQPASFVSPTLSGSENYGEYILNTIARYEDLRAATSRLVT